MVGKKYGETKSQKDVAEAAGVTEVTIRNRVQGLSKSILKEYSILRKQKKILSQ